MKRICAALFAAVFISSLCVPVLSSSRDASTPMNWYCRHVKNGETPVLDPQFAFIEKYDAVYLDKNANPENKTVYLTFDAGYENGNVGKILDILNEKNVKGAFFILENIAKKEPELVKRIAEGGHTICNHTAIHRDMTSVRTKEEFAAELDRLNDCVRETCGVEVSEYYRPPEGRFNESNLIWASELGYKTVFWSFAYADWDNDRQMKPEDALTKIIEGAHPGEVLLLHPTSATNAAVLSDLIDKFREMGYTFSTLDKLCSK
ncbi:MAG: polysaccharide deacetylase family protein [Clostridia bacterium]|nr:polysaccharide deacetylase family protein [Clostridia bacterium]